jgi:RNA polymerase sigma factor (sigma-70 family)
MHPHNEQEAIEVMIPLINSYAKELWHSEHMNDSYLSREDLIQEGQIGALQAYRSYESVHGISYKTWAHTRVKGAMKDAIRASMWGHGAKYRNPRKLWGQAVVWWRFEAKYIEHMVEKDGESFYPKSFYIGALFRLHEEQLFGNSYRLWLIEKALSTVKNKRNVAIYRAVVQEQRQIRAVAREYNLHETRVTQILQEVGKHITTSITEEQVYPLPKGFRFSQKYSAKEMVNI